MKLLTGSRQEHGAVKRVEQKDAVRQPGAELGFLIDLVLKPVSVNFLLYFAAGSVKCISIAA
jgi:hypothetical protein